LRARGGFDRKAGLSRAAHGLYKTPLLRVEKGENTAAPCLFGPDQLTTKAASL
jgi:hypothetical protein